MKYVGTPFNVCTNCFGEPSATRPRASVRLGRNRFASGDLPPRFRQAAAAFPTRPQMATLAEIVHRGLFKHSYGRVTILAVYYLVNTILGLLKTYLDL